MVFLVSRQRCFGQFSPTGARPEDCGPLCEQCCRSPCIASLEKGIGVERAQTGLFRGNGVSRSTQSLSPCRSRTSQVDGGLPWLLPVLQAFTPEFHGCSSGQAKKACKRSLRGYGDLSRMGMQWNNTRGLSVFLLGPCYQKACPMGMRRWRRRACCCMSWWRAHWWSCVRRFVAASRRGRRAVLPGYSVLGRLISSGIWTHLSLYFCVVFVRFSGAPEGGIVYGLFAREALYVGETSVHRTHCPGLAAHLTGHIRCLYRPGLKEANKPGYHFSGADYGVCVSFHWLSSPRFLKL